jgi:predicted MPP superfamily phosphohydrolase
MMMRFPRLLALSGLFALSLAACGEEAESLPSRPTEGATVATGAPWESIPADSLYGATPAENLMVTPVELDLLGIPDGWEGMRIAAVSDLQLGLWEGNDEVAASAIRRVVSLNADLIVLLGDYIARGEDTTALAGVLAPLRGKQVLAVLGDRDIRTDSLGAAITRTLGRQGIRVLKNGSVPIIHGEDTAYVAGVDPELATEPAGDQEWILSQLGSGRRGLLLTHNPVMTARAPDNRFPGALAGGVFCGRVEVPGSPRVSWLNENSLPGNVVRGVPRMYRFDRTVMFVTCGVGYSFLPIRFGAPPEIALITLHVSGRREPAVAAAAVDSMNLDSLLARYGTTDTTSADSAN